MILRKGMRPSVRNAAMGQITYQTQSEQPGAGGSSRSPRHSGVVSGSRETKDHAPPSPMRRATGVQRQIPPLSWEKESMRMSGTKSRPPQANGDARRRLEPAGSGIGISALPEPGYRISHIAVEEEPEHREKEEKRPVDPDLCHDLPLQNRPVKNGCNIEAYP